MTAAQLNKMLTTYRKNDKQAFRDIMTMAEARGISTKQYDKYGSTGALPTKPKWISESKANQKKVADLYNQISQKYGTSYSQYEKKRKKQYQRYKKSIKQMNDAGMDITPLSYDDYKDFRKNRDDLINEIYSIAYKVDANDGEDFDYVGLNDDIRSICDLDDESMVLSLLQEKLSDMQSQYENYNIIEPEDVEF